MKHSFISFLLILILVLILSTEFFDNSKMFLFILLHVLGSFSMQITHCIDLTKKNYKCDCSRTEHTDINYAKNRRGNKNTINFVGKLGVLCMCMCLCSGFDAIQSKTKHIKAVQSNLIWKAIFQIMCYICYVWYM